MYVLDMYLFTLIHTMYVLNFYMVQRRYLGLFGDHIVQYGLMETILTILSQSSEAQQN